jgi:hypothetical protein
MSKTTSNGNNSDPSDFVKTGLNGQQNTLAKKLAYAKKQLITKEDPYHMHKIIAMMCLVSFAFRFYNVGEYDMGFDLYPHLTIPTMLLHYSLNLSSFLFHIPKKRITHGGRIWPEYRIHSLVFNTRSQLVMAWYLLERYFGWEPVYFANYAILMLVFFINDFASRYVIEPQYQSNSVRGLDMRPASKFFFSVLQFNGTANLLLGMRRLTIPFLILFPIQMTAFAGTLQRKNLIRYNGLLLYPIIVFNSIRVQFYEYSREPPQVHLALRILMIGCALLRLSKLPKVFHPIQTRYGVWTLAYIILSYYRPRLEEIPVRNLAIILAILIALLPVSFYSKRDYYLTKESVTKKTI